MNKLIELKSLTKNYGEQQVLRGIDLDIHENEFLTLLGPSGCGKTTTLRIIAGFEEPSGGQVLFNGREISKLPPYKREVNTVFQKYALFPHMNVYDNIAFGLNLKKMNKALIKEKVARMLKLVDLEGYEKRDVTQLSGGQQQRVAIARALATDPEIIYFDEPTSALDPELTGEVLSVMRRLADEGMTMLVVTHELGFAKNISTRTMFIEGGVVVEEAPSREFFANPRQERTKAFLRAISSKEEE